MDSSKRGPVGRGRGRGVVCEDSSDEDTDAQVKRGRGRGGRKAVAPGQPGSSSVVAVSSPTFEELTRRYDDCSIEGTVVRTAAGTAPTTSIGQTASSSVPVTHSERRSAAAGMGYYPSMDKNAGKAESVAKDIPALPIDPEDSLAANIQAVPGRGRGRARGKCPSDVPDIDTSTNTQVGSSTEPGSVSSLPKVQLPALPVDAVVGEAVPVEEVAVAQVEAVAAAAGDPAPKEKKKRLPTVTKIGERGEMCQLACNYLRLYYENKQRIQEYHVDFEPSIDSTRSKRKALDQFEPFLGPVRNFDGHVLFLPKALPKLKTVLDGIHPGDKDLPITLTINFVKEKDAEDMTLFLNILFKKVMRTLQHVQLRDNYYDIKAIKRLPQHKLEIWPGNCLAIEEREGGLMLCLDASHRVLRTETVHEYYKALKGQPEWEEHFAEFIVGKIVLTRYNNMCYKIDDIMWDLNPSHTFQRKDEMLSYSEYYRIHHNVEIKDLKQPLLLSRIKPRRNDPAGEDKMVCLVPELCFVTGLTEEQRSNFTVMKDLGEHTRLQPLQRKDALKKFVHNINSNPEAKKILSDWNLCMDNNPVFIQARQITAPTLNFGKDKNVGVTADFTRNATSSVHEPREVVNFLVVCTKRDAEKARHFCDIYRQVCITLGIRMMGGPFIMPLKGAGYQVTDFRRAIKENLTEHFQFLVVIMPQQRDDLYGCIKTTAVADIGVPSQCILTKTISNEKRLRSVVQKIALQINCKLGGSLWGLDMPIKEQVMFVGIDVAHDPKRKHPSVLGVVASMNNQCTKYFSVCRIMKVHQEIADSLQSAFTDALKEFHQQRLVFPNRIVAWRDGGSIASIDFFREHEAAQMQTAINLLCPDAKFSYVVIQKRIAQRFFQMNLRGTEWKNPDPGTVIDHTVTSRTIYDFFVCSQLTRQGTITPTHYVVAFDPAETKPDLMQKFAYATSFMYYNWSGTIRVPAMTQYAHKLAGLIGNYVRADPKKELVQTLYYL